MIGPVHKTTIFGEIWEVKWICNDHVLQDIMYRLAMNGWGYLQPMLIIKAIVAMTEKTFWHDQPISVEKM